MTRIKQHHALFACFLFAAVAIFLWSSSSQHAAASANSQPFTYTGSDQTFTVPTGVTSVTVKMWGAAGGPSYYELIRAPGGGGGYTTAQISVVPGQSYKIIVGRGGLYSGGTVYGGGGDLYPSYVMTLHNSDSSGGGRSAFCASNSGSAGLCADASSELLTAGGGGGGRMYYDRSKPNLGSQAGGAGGGVAGQDGLGNAGLYGTGGSQTQGGLYTGYPTISGYTGRQFLGCGYTTYSQYFTASYHFPGGMGGGGWYGGGCGNNPAPAGGGSGHCGTTGVSSCVTATGSGPIPANSGDTDLPAGTASGGDYGQVANGVPTAVPGGNGFVLISWTDPPPSLQCNGTPELYSTPGTYTRTVPTYGLMTVEVWGGGGGGSYNFGQGGTGSNSSFQSVTGNGGQGGIAVSGSGTGAGGTASGGTTNTPGSAGQATFNAGGAGGASPSGGSGGSGGAASATPGNAPGGGGGGVSRGGGGGGGGYASRVYSSGDLSQGAAVILIVGSGGSGYSPGGNGAPGQVTITCSSAPPPDTTPPAVSLTAPASGAELTGTVTLSATASDNTAVAGVQFKLDNMNAGTEDTTSPYSISWDSAGTSNGSHTIAAVARDAAGNYATSSISVTVNNIAPDVISGWAWSDTIGWISMAGTNYGFTIASSGDISGYGWSDTIGWVSANQSDLTNCPSGACKAKLVGNNMQGWLKALSADGNGWDGWISLNGSSPQYGVTKNQDGTFTGYAWGDTNVGWVDFSYAKTGYSVCTPSYSCSTQTIQHTDSSCNITNVTTCIAPNFCSAGSSTCISAPPSFNQSAGFTGHMQAVPTLLPQNTPTKLYWNVSNVTSCTVTGTNGDHWSGAASPSGGQVSSPLVQQTTFTLSCTGLDSSSVNESVVVNILPVFQER